MALLYHTGKKPAGYVTLFNPLGKKIELETRQCSHCHTQWIYKPGSKRKYGVCLVCFGYTCMKKECNEKCEPFEKRLEDYEKGRRVSL